MKNPVEEKVKKSFDFLKIEHPLSKIPKTSGQKAADIITKWAGSWAFILIFFIFLAVWMILNTAWLLFGSKWDPYPFILLNLALSCLAAIQAPVILMSQNRQTQRDRIKINYDYHINKKAEKEIREIKSLLMGKYRKK